jgi:hypothetical protein
MHIYCDIQIILDDIEFNKSVEHYIYTQNEIYKLYKKHFYILDLDIKNDTIHYKQKEYLIENDNSKINKNKLISHIPYYHYYVLKEIYKYSINDNISIIKEILNGKLHKQYFDVNNYDISIFEELCLLNK